MHPRTIEIFLCYAVFVGVDAQHDPSHLPTRIIAQLDVLERGIVAAKAQLEAYLAVPLRGEVAFSHGQWVQLWFAMTAAVRLDLLLRSVPTGTMHLISFLNTPELLDRISKRFEAITAPITDGSDAPSVFKLHAHRADTLRVFHSKHIAVTGASQTESDLQSFVSHEAQPNPPHDLEPTEPSQSSGQTYYETDTSLDYVDWDNTAFDPNLSLYQDTNMFDFNNIWGFDQFSFQ